MSVEAPSAIMAFTPTLRLEELFGLVCGQNPAHTWAPGGLPLPCCQRCLGLYAGAAIALFMHVVLRPRLTGRFLEIHGLFLLLMVPLGFHWVPQETILRSNSGLLFGAAVATFLWLPLAARARVAPAFSRTAVSSRFSSAAVYALAIGLCAFFLPFSAARGGEFPAMLLALWATAGLLSLAALVAWNLLLATYAVARGGRSLSREPLNRSADAVP